MGKTSRYQPISYGKYQQCAVSDCWASLIGVMTIAMDKRAQVQKNKASRKEREEEKRRPT